MAFVFRSEKKATPPPSLETKEQQTLNEGESKVERHGEVCKGLPHILQKQLMGSEKQNCLPDIEAHPIHSPSTFSFNTTVFKSREFNDTKMSHYVSGDEPNIKPVLTVKELSQKKVSSVPFATINRPDNMADSKSAKTLGKLEEKPHIINKNLLKTMLHMSQKYKETLEIDKIAINESKEGDGSLKKNKFKGWKSLKRLSPLKDHRDFSKLSQTDDINISCGQKPCKEEAKATQKLSKTMLPKPKEVQKDAQTSEEEEQYLDDATPGPGTYSYQHPNNKKQFRSKRRKFQKIFYSQIERFRGQEKKFQEVTFINDEASQKEALNKSSSVCQSFLSKSPKFKESQEGANPPPGYYDTRQTLEHDLVRHILKSSNTTTFINRSPRLFKVKGGEMPGPGSYMLDRSFQKLLEEKDKLSYSYKSQLERQLGHSPKQQGAINLKCIYDPSNEASVIHVKEDAVLEQQHYYITQAPPFMSSTDRFPKLKAQFSNDQSYHKTRDNIVVPSPPKQAFNSSGKRETFGKVGEGVGIGLYNLSKDIWSKKSYNILFN